jgi:hypothetical protein
MSAWTIDDVVERQRQEEDQKEEVLTITLPELRTGDLNIPLETIQLRVYRPLPNEPDEAEDAQGSDQVRKGPAAVRWKDVRRKAVIRERELLSRLSLVVKAIISRGPSEKMSKDWNVVKQICGTDPTDEAFDKAYKRALQWESEVLKQEVLRTRRERFVQMTKAGISSWIMKKFWEEVRKDYEIEAAEEET